MENEKMRTCRVCKQYLSLNNENFHTSKYRKSGTINSEKKTFRHTCRRCKNEDTLRQYRSPEQQQRYRRNHLQKTYNLSLEKYNEMFESQDGVCYICKKKFDDGKLLGVDHNHATGTIRKLLCRPCNTGLGCFRDDPILLLKVIDYLKEHHEDPEV